MQKAIISFISLIGFSFAVKAQDQSQLDHFLRNKSISKTAKEYYQDKFKAADNVKTFSILDSMSTNNSETRPFYLYLATQMMKSSDGALSEELGVRAKQYLEKHPNWALTFLKSKLSTASFIVIWAKTIAGEINIDCEDKEQQCANEWYEKSLRKTNAENKPTLKELYKQVSARCP